MTLPVRANLDDVLKVTKFLMSRPTGASAADIRRSLDSSADGRKLAALKTWGIIVETDDRFKLSDGGRAIAKDASNMPPVFRKAVREVQAYYHVLEWWHYKHPNEDDLLASDVGSYWHDKFANEASESNEVLNEQVICFFQALEGAGLGRMYVGRRGQPTRFELDLEEFGRFFDQDNESKAAAPSDNEAQSSKPSAEEQYPIQSGSDSKASSTSQNTEVAPPPKKSESLDVFLWDDNGGEQIQQVRQLVELSRGLIPVDGNGFSLLEAVAQLKQSRAAVISSIHQSGETSLSQGVLLLLGASVALLPNSTLLITSSSTILPSFVNDELVLRVSGPTMDFLAATRILKVLSAV